MNRRKPSPIGATGALRPDRLRRGYFLFEIMIVLGIMGVFAIVAFRLLATSMNVSVDAQRRTETAERFDLAMNQLRADVWTATSIEADGLSTTLGQPDGRKVIWRFEPETAAPDARDEARKMFTLSRHTNAADGNAEAASTDTRWRDMPRGIEFTAAGPALRVRTPTVSASADKLTMISQLQLQGRTP